MIQKIIVMLLSVVWERIQERTRNFGHLVYETWPQTYVRSVFKFYKKQTCTKSSEKKLCRVPGHGTRQRGSLPSAKNKGLSKEGFEFFLKKFIFAECLHMGTRQRPLKKILCRAPCQGHSAKYFPKKNLCRVPDLGHSAKKFKKN